MRNKLLTLIIFLLSIAGVAFAQVGDPCPGGNCDPDVPITGIEWLLVAGGLFGARKVYKNFKRH